LASVALVACRRALRARVAIANDTATYISRLDESWKRARVHKYAHHIGPFLLLNRDPAGSNPAGCWLRLHAARPQHTGELSGATRKRAGKEKHGATLLMYDLLKDLWGFMKERKKFWLAPIIVVLLILGGLIVFAQGSAVAPFIYTLF
jgi:hypothetical protein